MKKNKARHLWHGVFAFFILLSFFGAMVLLESQGSLITGFAVSEISADSPITATLGTGISVWFKWQGQEYSLRANTISLGEGKVKLEVIKPSVPSATAAAAITSTPARTATTTTAKTSTPTSPTRTATTTTSPTITSTRTTTTTPTTTRSSTTTTIVLAKCQDKIDNDKDGKIDYPADRGCISLKDNDETDTVTTSTTSTRTTTTTPTTTSTRTTTTTPTTTATRSTTATTTSGSTVTGRATVSTTTAARSPTTTTTPTTTTSTTAARSTSTTTTPVSGTTAAVSSSKKLGDFELLKTEEKGFDLDEDGSEDVIFTLLDVLSSKQAIVEIKVKEKVEVPIDGKTSLEEPAPDGTLPAENVNLIYFNDLIDVNEILDDTGQSTASYEVTYHFNEIGKRIPFSFPCKPEGVSSIEDDGALGSIKDKIKAVYSYDANEKWLIWNPDTEAPSNMQEYFYDYFPDDPESAQFFFGYYLVLKEKTELTIICSDLGADKFEMIPGWNVFGIHGMEEKEAGELLKESAEISEISEFKEGKIQKLSDKKKTKLQPGKVYWANLKKGIALQNPAGIITEEEGP